MAHILGQFLGAKYHLEVTPNIRVAYYSFKAPWPVNNRDFLTVAGETLTVTKPTLVAYNVMCLPYVQEDNLFVSVVNSIEREDFPEQEGFVRAILKNSGFVVKPIENDENGKPRCKVTYVVSMNPMGWIPTWCETINSSLYLPTLGSSTWSTLLSRCASTPLRMPYCSPVQCNLSHFFLLTSKSEVLIAEGLRKLEALPEEEWKAANLRRLTNKVIDAHNGKQEVRRSLILSSRN